MSRIYSFSSKNSHYICVVAFVFLFHSFSILRKFAWGDDWAFISAYKQGALGVTTEHYSGYRPLLQKIMDFSFGNIHNYEDLVFLRLIATLGLVIVVWLLMEKLGKLGFSKNFTCAVGLGVSLMPTFWIYTNWASTFIYSWVCALSILSLNLFDKHKLISFSVIVTCFLIYQPAAVFSVTLIFAAYIQKGKLSRANIQYLSAVLTGAIFAIATGKMLNQLLDVPAKTRTGFISSPGEFIDKVIWLASRPLVLSFRPFLVESHGLVPLGITVVGFALSAVAFMHIAKKGGLLRNIYSFIALYCFGMLSLLPISENQIEFRILPTTSAMGLILVGIGVQTIFKQKSPPFFLKSLIGVLVIFVVAVYSETKIQQIFIKPFQVNQKLLLDVAGTNSLEKVIIISDYSVAWPQRNYVGALSVISDFQMPWVPVGEVSQVLRIDESKITLVDSKLKNVQPNVLVINLNSFRDKL